MERLTKTLTKAAATYSRLRCMKTLQQSSCRSVSTSQVAQYKWEPEGLTLEPEIPLINNLNLNLYSYDYVVLESFAKYVYRAVLDQKVPVKKWAVPLKKLKVNTMKPKTKVLIDTSNMNRYHRVVQRFMLLDHPVLVTPEVVFVNEEHTRWGTHGSGAVPIQLEMVDSVTLPLLLERIQHNTPEGVEVEVKQHTDEDEEFLYVPDLEKLELEETLRKMEAEKEMKRK